jgi:hypothetical protein
MRMTRPTLAKRLHFLLSASLAAAVLSCSTESIDTPRVISVGRASAAKGGGTTGPSVASASPTYGDEGTTIDVHVFGSGFASGAQATWLLHGVADPTHVRTNKTTFISSTEIVANITIASDAQVALWDVQVALAGGKNGVGSELFEVTSAQVLGPGTTGGDALVYGISELGQVVGNGRPSGTRTAFVYDDISGMVALGPGEAWAIDPLGTIAVGRDGNLSAAAWVQQSAATWTMEHLPTLPFSVNSHTTSAARAADNTLLVGGADDSALSTKPNTPDYNRPVVWRRSGGVWSMPQRYTLPSGALRGSVHSVNGNGQASGIIDGFAAGAVWDNPTAVARLDGFGNSINPAGTLVVGEVPVSGFDRNTSNTVPVFWWRNPATGAWTTTGTRLPSLAGATCAFGKVHGINSAGILVGTSCNSAGQIQATVWRLDFSGATPVLIAGPIGLPGLGPGPKNSQTTISNAVAITDAAPYTIAGVAFANGTTQLAVRWRFIIP